MMTAVIIVLGLLPPIPTGILPVPIVMQNAGIMLSPLLLGKKEGTISVLLLLFLSALGFPFLPGGRGGISVFLTSTSGYLFSYPLAAFLIGWLTERLNRKNKKVYITFGITLLGGVFFINFIGLTGIALSTNLSFKSCLISSLIFLPGDFCKAIVVTFLAYRIDKYVVN